MGTSVNSATIRSDIAKLDEIQQTLCEAQAALLGKFVEVSNIGAYSYPLQAPVSGFAEQLEEFKQLLVDYVSIMEMQVFSDSIPSSENNHARTKAAADYAYNNIDTNAATRSSKNLKQQIQRTTDYALAFDAKYDFSEESVQAINSKQNDPEFRKDISNLVWNLEERFQLESEYINKQKNLFKLKSYLDKKDVAAVSLETAKPDKAKKQAEPTSRFTTFLQQKNSGSIKKPDFKIKGSSVKDQKLFFSSAGSSKDKEVDKVQKSTVKPDIDKNKKTKSKNTTDPRRPKKPR